MIKDFIVAKFMKKVLECEKKNDFFDIIGLFVFFKKGDCNFLKTKLKLI